MGSTIDRIVSPISSLLRGEADPRRRISIIKGMKDEMRDAYHDIVEGSEDFKAHQSWINSFRLRSRIVEVRPTVRELYLFKDRTVDKRLKRLVKKRDRLRKRACARVSPQMVKISLAYHEEFDVAWLREMESTLGYPDCYANAYASDRQSHVNIEKRASRQIDNMY